MKLFQVCELSFGSYERFLDIQTVFVPLHQDLDQLHWTVNLTVFLRALNELPHIEDFRLQKVVKSSLVQHHDFMEPEGEIPAHLVAKERGRVVQHF